jgi:hypothetical protein
LPAGFAVGLAGEEAAQAGNATQKVPVGGETFRRSLKLGGEDPDCRLRHVRWGGAVATGSIAQAEEKNGDDGQRSEQRDQPIRLRHVPLLGPAFQALLNSSTLQHREYQAVMSSAWSDGLDRPGGQQQLFQGTVPDAHALDPVSRFIDRRGLETPEDSAQEKTAPHRPSAGLTFRLFAEEIILFSSGVASPW